MELESRYDPHAHESDIYDRWMSSGAFTPAAEKPGDAEPFVIMIPPPNVTGVLHMGHALNGTLQDITIRFQRMRGRDALWLPGTDHAGIATQAVVEKKLCSSWRGTSPATSVGREALVEKRIFAWKDEYQANKIVVQQQEPGLLLRLVSGTRFTMDAVCSRARCGRPSYRLFRERDLIYRGDAAGELGLRACRPPCPTTRSRWCRRRASSTTCAIR